MIPSPETPSELGVLPVVRSGGRELVPDGLDVDPPSHDSWAYDWRDNLRERYVESLLDHLRYGNCLWHDPAMLDRIERTIGQLEREAKA